MYISTILFALAGTTYAAPSESPNLYERVNNGVGVAPAMGFNNWNSGLPSSASTAIAAANAFVSLGLKAAGYIYINTDDAWASKSRSNGLLVPDPSKWPNGIKAVADQLHGMGFKMGLYGDSGTATCAGYPGSAGYETADAKTLAGWGIDLWKYDNCATPSTNSSIRYTTMSKALAASGRPIYYAMCNWGNDNVWQWGGVTGNSWRISGDITNNWASVVSIASGSEWAYPYAARGGFNDFDMLEVGNYGMSAAEERSHFAIWAMVKSPLLIGSDLTKISSSSLAILKNADVIAINQDSLGKAAHYFQPAGKGAPQSGQLYPYWAGPLSDGYVVGLIAANGAATLSVSFADVPGLGAGTYSWKECYTGKTGSGTGLSATLESHDIAIFHVYKSGSGPATTTTRSSGGGGGTIAQWAQCGGTGWTGSGTCVSGTSCVYSNQWYSQCR